MQIAGACSPALLLFHHKFITASVLSEEVVSFKKDDGVLNFLLSSPLSHPCIWPSPH